MQQTMEPRYEIPSRKFFTKKPIPALYDETRGKVEDALQSAKRNVLTWGGWTTWATESYMTILLITSEKSTCKSYKERDTQDSFWCYSPLREVHSPLIMLISCCSWRRTCIFEDELKCDQVCNIQVTSDHWNVVRFIYVKQAGKCWYNVIPTPMLSDKVYDMLLSTCPCFSITFLMTRWHTRKKQQKDNVMVMWKSKTSIFSCFYLHLKTCIFMLILV